MKQSKVTQREFRRADPQTFEVLVRRVRESLEKKYTLVSGRVLRGGTQVNPVTRWVGGRYNG